MAANSISSATMGAAGGIEKQAMGFTQSEIDQLAADVKTAAAIAQSLGATVGVTTSNLTPAFQQMVQAEIDAAKKALEPFLMPVMGFASAVKAFSAMGSVRIFGLQAAYDGAMIIIARAFAGLGLPAFKPPTFTAPAGASGGNALGF
jgi:hypothetical protein